MSSGSSQISAATDTKLMSIAQHTRSRQNVNVITMLQTCNRQPIGRPPAQSQRKVTFGHFVAVYGLRVASLSDALYQFAIANNLVVQETQLMLTNRVTRSEVSQGTWDHSIC